MEWCDSLHSGLDVDVERLFDHVDERRQIVGFEIAGDATRGVRNRQLHTILTAYLAQRLVDGRVLKMESWWLSGDVFFSGSWERGARSEITVVFSGSDVMIEGIGSTESDGHHDDGSYPPKWAWTYFTQSPSGVELMLLVVTEHEAELAVLLMMVVHVQRSVVDG